MSSVDPSRLMQYVLGLRQSGVTDPRVLSAMEKAPRSAFAPPEFAALALEDDAIPLAPGAVLQRPSVLARMVAALQVAPDHRVLEIGAGAGFGLGVLSMLAKRVVGVERRRSLVSKARANLGAMRIMNAHVHHGDGLSGWPDEAPYDRIIMHQGAPPFVPALINQLREGGLLLAPSGLPGRLHLRLFEAVEGRLLERADLGPFEAAMFEAGVIDDT